MPQATQSIAILTIDRALLVLMTSRRGDTAREALDRTLVDRVSAATKIAY